MVRLGTSSNAPVGALSPALELSFGPSEKPPFTDPGGVGTSREGVGCNPAITKEVSEGSAFGEVTAGGALAMVGAAAALRFRSAGGTNLRGILGSACLAGR